MCLLTTTSLWPAVFAFDVFSIAFLNSSFIIPSCSRYSLYLKRPRFKLILCFTLCLPRRLWKFLFYLPLSFSYFIFFITFNFGLLVLLSIIFIFLPWKVCWVSNCYSSRYVFYGLVNSYFDTCNPTYSSFFNCRYPTALPSQASF